MVQVGHDMKLETGMSGGGNVEIRPVEIWEADWEEVKRRVKKIMSGWGVGCIIKVGQDEGYVVWYKKKGRGKGKVGIKKGWDEGKMGCRKNVD